MSDEEQRAAVASEDEEMLVSLAMVRVGGAPAPWVEQLWAMAVELVSRSVLELFQEVLGVEEADQAGSIEASSISEAVSISIK